MSYKFKIHNEYLARQDDEQTVRQLRRDIRDREVSENFQKITALRQAFPRSRRAKIKEVSERIARNVALKEERDLKKELDARQKGELEVELADDKIRETVKAKSKNASVKSPHPLGLAATIKRPAQK